MDYPIHHPRFQKWPLAVRLPGVFSSPQLIVAGGVHEVKKRITIPTQDDEGRKVEIVAKPGLLDAVPKVEIAGEEVPVAGSFEWYEWVWIFLPLVLVVSGGAIGGAIGGATAAINARVFRFQQGSARWGLSGIFLVIALVIYFAVAVIFGLAFLPGR